MTERPALPEAAIRDHLANERTLLAWQRTALTVIGLGFIVDRFAFERAEGGVSALLGLALIALGAVVAVLGTQRYLRTEREIDTATYRPSVTVHLLLTAVVVGGAALLVVYLVSTPG